jgi:puromycin-sensitive aminopeptidase
VTAKASKSAARATRRKASAKKTARKKAAARKKAGPRGTKKAGKRSAKKKAAAAKKRGAKRKASATKKGAKKKASRKKPAAKKPSAKRAAAKRRPVKKSAAKRAKASPRKAAPGRAAGHRLTQDVRPASMDIHFDVDASTSDRYSGEVGITLQLARPCRSIELHACEMRVNGAQLRAAGEHQRGRVVAHPERETVEIVFGKPIPAGHARLELSFAAKLRGDLRGLYRARSGERQLAFSQLAATQARRTFPCFDEPAMKARYRISVTTGVANQVVSNGSIESEEIHEDGRKTVHFSATPLLSTYLVALAVGELVASRTEMCGRTPIRVWHTPGQEGLADFALEVARESLSRLEAYFGLAHPYEKLDLVAVPDFEFGAMENAGAVFFRETLLLLDPATASTAEKKRAAEVICHELAHMWYGNLVTMAWWDDLWLNEAFATWMAFEILDGWRPEWNLWQNFQHRRAAAMDADALSHTHPIYAPVKSADEAAENFDLITYEKGASVIRMIESYLGADVFRDGVRRYIRRHRESNAVAADLWNALSEAAALPVEPMVRPWLEQSGHPVVSIGREERDGLGVITLRQERHLMHRGKGPKKDGTRWPIPILARIGTGMPGETREARHLLTKAREVVPAQGADLTFIYSNANEAGFYRPNPDAGLLKDQIEELGALRPIERQGLIDHQWALVRSGHTELSGLLDLAAALGADKDPDVLAAVGAPLLSLSKRLAPDVAPASEPRLRAWVAVYFGAQVDELGWDPAPGEDAATRQRRAEIMHIVGVIGEATTLLQEAEGRAVKYLADPSTLDPNLASVVLGMAAARGDEALHESILAAMHSAKTPQDKRRMLLALGDFSDPELIARSLELCIDGSVPAQDVIFLLERLMANRHACEPTWAFVKRRWSRLRGSLPAQLGGRLIAATPALLTPAYRREVAGFFREHPLPASARALRQALERFDWYAAFRGRTGPQLEAYLSGRSLA